MLTNHAQKWLKLLPTFLFKRESWFKKTILGRKKFIRILKLVYFQLKAQSTTLPRRRYNNKGLILLLALLNSLMALNICDCWSQWTITIGGRITLLLTSCLTGFDLTEQVKLLFNQHKKSSWIQTAIQWYFPLS